MGDIIDYEDPCLVRDICDKCGADIYGIAFCDCEKTREERSKTWRELCIRMTEIFKKMERENEDKKHKNQ